MQWGPDTHLLATIVDLEAIAAWQRSGGKASSRPEPIPRPGVKPGERLGVSMPASEWEARRKARSERGRAEPSQ